MRKLGALACVTILALSNRARADEYQLLIGADKLHWPGPIRQVSPTMVGCCASDFGDADRLAGNLPAGPVVDYLGNGTPLYDPNEFGSLSFLFRRGVFPDWSGSYPWQGVDFLGGPLLDLDGSNSNATRSLIPIPNKTAVEIPGRTSYIELNFNKPLGYVSLINLDATGTNEGGIFIGPGIATTVNVIAGTDVDGSVDLPKPNPTLDTRVGTLVAHTTGGLTTVWKADNLGYEFWQDTVLLESGTADTLGTFQFLGRMSGWLIERNPATGQFPTLAGKGLGTTPWPRVDTAMVGQNVNTAHGLVGGTGTIGRYYPGIDDFAAPGTGGTGPVDLGVYFDTVIVPRISPLSDGFVYLQSAGYGLNNSADPLYIDSISYDAVFIAQRAPRLNLRNYAAFQRCASAPGIAAGCAGYDFDADGDVDLGDYPTVAHLLVGP
jgi:hypothetical protein